MQASMSRRGNCNDYAPAERFWGTLKNELIHHRRYATREQARPGFLSQAAFRQQYLRQSTAAWHGAHLYERDS
jgi:transposase InsO family protein